MADYATLSLTLGRHPLALLRERLQRMHLITAAELNRLPQGRIARTAGIVTCRQHPSTASGVTFVTIEDETGCVNVVVWRALAERQRRELLASRLMGIAGTIEREGEVVHLVGGQAVRPHAAAGAARHPVEGFLLGARRQPVSPSVRPGTSDQRLRCRRGEHGSVSSGAQPRVHPSPTRSSKYGPA